MQRVQVSPAGSLLALFVMLILFSTYIRERGRIVFNSEPEEFKGEPRVDDWWGPLHESFVDEAKSTRFDVIFYGDSITEAWRGTSAGEANDKYAGNAKAFADVIQNSNKSRKIGIFGAAGDQTQHLLYRLHNGELNGDRPPAFAVVLIGTNDLGWARIRAEGEDEEETINAAVPEITKHLLLILKKFQSSAPSTKVLMVGLLPRGSGSSGSTAFQQPSLYTAALEEINQHLREYGTHDARIKLVDCTDIFISNDGTVLDRNLMPDGLHPTGDGAVELAKCISQSLDKLMQS